MTEYFTGETTKAEFISNHPTTILAKNLKANDWPDDQPILLTGGDEVTEKTSPKSNGSNLMRALERSPL
jgi:hypothetical protein